MKKLYCILAILSAGLFLGCSNDAIYYEISTEKKPTKAKMSGYIMPIVENSQNVMFVANPGGIWEYSNTADTTKLGTWSYFSGSPSGYISQTAMVGNTLYVLTYTKNADSVWYTDTTGSADWHSLSSVRDYAVNGYINGIYGCGDALVLGSQSGHSFYLYYADAASGTPTRLHPLWSGGGVDPDNDATGTLMGAAKADYGNYYISLENMGLYTLTSFGSYSTTPPGTYIPNSSGYNFVSFYNLAGNSTDGLQQFIAVSRGETSGDSDGWLWKFDSTTGYQTKPRFTWDSGTLLTGGIGKYMQIPNPSNGVAQTLSTTDGVLILGHAADNSDSDYGFYEIGITNNSIGGSSMNGLSYGAGAAAGTNYDSSIELYIVNTIYQYQDGMLFMGTIQNGLYTLKHDSSGLFWDAVGKDENGSVWTGW
jgi:hypothetical protein